MYSQTMQIYVHVFVVRSIKDIHLTIQTAKPYLIVSKRIKNSTFSLIKYRCLYLRESCDGWLWNFFQTHQRMSFVTDETQYKTNKQCTTQKRSIYFYSLWNLFKKISPAWNFKETDFSIIYNSNYPERYLNRIFFIQIQYYTVKS